jgi:hypothetical protein
MRIFPSVLAIALSLPAAAQSTMKPGETRDFQGAQ